MIEKFCFPDSTDFIVLQKLYERMLAKIYGSAVQGVQAFPVTVEVSVGTGTEMFIVGLPDAAVKESSHRVESAIKEADFQMPRQKVVVNLAPADTKKEGSSYDLPIAIGVLVASGQISSLILEEYLIMGELSLDGSAPPIKGVLPIAIEARGKFKGFILPKQNASEAAIVSNLDVIGVENLMEAVDFLENRIWIEPLVRDTKEIFFSNLNNYEADFSHVQGQENIKRALEIAAAGGHNVIHDRTSGEQVKPCWPSVCLPFSHPWICGKPWKQPKFIPWQGNCRNSMVWLPPGLSPFSAPHRE